MKSITNILGIILVVLGVIALGYNGISYTTEEKVAEVGPIKLSADKKTTIPFTPLEAGLCLAAGVILIMIGRRS